MQTLTVESAYEIFSHSNIKVTLNLEDQVRPGGVAFVMLHTWEMAEQIHLSDLEI